MPQGGWAEIMTTGPKRKKGAQTSGIRSNGFNGGPNGLRAGPGGGGNSLRPGGSTGLSAGGAGAQGSTGRHVSITPTPTGSTGRHVGGPPGSITRKKVREASILARIRGDEVLETEEIGPLTAGARRALVRVLEAMDCESDEKGDKGGKKKGKKMPPWMMKGKGGDSDSDFAESARYLEAYDAFERVLEALPAGRQPVRRVSPGQGPRTPQAGYGRRREGRPTYNASGQMAKYRQNHTGSTPGGQVAQPPHVNTVNVKIGGGPMSEQGGPAASAGGMRRGNPPVKPVGPSAGPAGPTTQRRRW